MNDNKNDTSNKLTLQRKTRSTLSVSSVGGKNKKVQIEIRKKLTYVQCTLPSTEITDVKRKVVHNVNNELTDFAIKSKSVDKKADDTSNQLLSKQISKRNSKYIESIECKEKVTEKICRKISEQSLEMVDDIRSVKKRSDSHWNIKLNKSVLHADLGDSSVAHETSMSLVDGNDNNKKLEDERINRSRVRARYRGGGKLAKQRKKNTASYRLYEIFTDEFSREEELYIPNRIGKHKRKQSALLQSFNKPNTTIARDIVIGETISVVELANKMSIKSSSVIKVMMQLGIVATINQVLDQETAQLVAEEMGHNVVLRRVNELEEWIMNDRDIGMKNCIVTENRAPIVTVMGHVDHGKTSLLDRIRSTKIASAEVGGITQSIGAYHVRTNNGGVITFLDTPGHAAFTAMRARGVKLTDIVVLVVAADDGVMPQTIEAIQHIKVAKVPVVVAINKIDKLGVDPNRIKSDLNGYGIIPEEWGGDTQFVNVSALSGEGVNSLLDAILLQSEMLELKVIQRSMASAIVIESFLDKKRGPVVSVLVREGTLKCGDPIVCGTAYGRVRAMRDEFGHDVTLAGPSIPVELLGLSGTPDSGEMVIVVRDEKKARELALYRQEKFREIKLTHRKESNVENIFAKIKNIDSISELNFIVKSDTRGSVEAICESLEKLSTDNVIVKILYSSVGGITETDATLAATSNAIILGFNVRADLSARHVIDLDQLDVRYYSVIHDLLNEVKQIVHGMLSSRYTHKVVGLAEVRNVFHAPKYGNIAGCLVIEGIIKRSKQIRVIRDSVVIYEGELESLRRFKNDVNEVKSGIECGIGIKNYNDIHSGDIIEVFDVAKIDDV